ncbi:MAG: hypothetical protein V3G42_13885 [Oscillospiraceae bacterium]
MEIVFSDKFLEMPGDAQRLYFFMLGDADDYGFVSSPKSLMRRCNIPEDNYKILLAKAYIIPFDSGVIVVRHWRQNNYIRKERRQDPHYKMELSRLVAVDGEYKLIDIEISRDDILRLQPTGEEGVYTTCTPVGVQVGDTEEEREEEERSEKNSSFYSLHSNSVSVSENEIPTIEEVQAYCNEKGYTFDVQKFMRHNQKCNWRYKDGTPKNWRTNADQWQCREWNKFQKPRVLPKPKPQPNPSESSEQSPYSNSTIDK